jgi:hypothetical protein
MNADPKAKLASANSAGESRYKTRFVTFLNSRRGKMFGVAEVAGLAGSCLVLVLVLLSYLYFVVPARSRVASLISDRKQTQTNLQTLEGVVSKEQDTKQTVEGITSSLTRFETVNLMRQDRGLMALYEELNQLIIKNGLQNTSGPESRRHRSGRAFIPVLP